ncbi:MAG: ribosomal protein S18-alanine N-acetyltransferase [Candidatus Heteroscillospira sp.]|jgi:ribosomal-protein-alanine N-acetyltransferase
MSTVRDAVPGDIPRIAEIEKRCFSTPWSEDMLRIQLREGYVFLVCEDGGETAGYVGLQYVLDEGYISNVAVAPESRRRGIASALLCELDRRAEKLSLSFASLEVRASNAAAIALYTARGYENVGLRKSYYENPREDALIMTKYYGERT